MKNEWSMNRTGSPAPMSNTRAMIQRLIDEQLYSIVYQPITDLRTRQIVGFEALTRLAEGSGFDSPTALYEAGEAEDMLWELEGAARRQAFKGAAQWPEHLQLFINCAPNVAEDPRFESQLMSELESSRARYPAQVVVEITERAPTLHMEALMPRIDALRQQGLQIAIDDVGIGASGLVRISSLRPGWLKLDRALIDHIDQDRFRWNLVRHLVRFARACGVQVVAEGLEREADIQACRDLDICFGQGFLLGMPTSDPLHLLRQTPPPQQVRTAKAAHDASRESLAMLRGVQPAYTLDHDTTVASAAQDLLRDPSLPGVCVIRERRLLGFVRREDALRDAGTEDRRSMPVSFLARTAPSLESESLDFSQLFELAATQAQGGVAAEGAITQWNLPIIVTDQGQPRAAITTPALLSIAADLARRYAQASEQTDQPPPRERAA